MDPVVIALTFGAIFVVELPDKTFIAALVLSTRYHPLAVWIGVGLAFLVQTGIAVGLGHAVSFLPQEVVQGVAAAIFAVGAILLVREAPTADAGGTRAEEEAVETASVVGCLCTPLDLLGADVPLPRTEIGDLVVLFQAGAYGLTASPTQFLGHPAPAEVLV